MVTPLWHTKNNGCFFIKLRGKHFRFTVPVGWNGVSQGSDLKVTIFYFAFVSSAPFLPVPRARVRVRRSHAQSSTSRHKISSPLHMGKRNGEHLNSALLVSPFSVLCTQQLSVVLVVKTFHSLSRLACCSVHRSAVFFCRCGMHVPFDFQLDDTNKNFFEFLKVENGNF